MTETMWIRFFLFFALYCQHADAQSTESLTIVEGEDVTLSCTLSGTFILPVWQGPPNLKTYTIQDAVDEAINPDAPAFGRLKFASNQKDLVLSNANISDAGDYKCTYSQLGDHTVTLSVTAKQCTCDCNCKKVCKGIVIPSIVFGGLGAVTLTVVIGGTVTEHFGRITALVVDVIGFVCDVISLGLGIGVQVEDCCKDAADCCEDSDCCEVECEKNWIETTAIVFIIIGCLVGIVSGVIFYLVWSGRIGRGNNAYKAKEAKEPGENHGMTGTSM